MKIGDELNLTIESVALTGEGIARNEAIVFFVDGALTGEQAKVQITKIEKNLVRAKSVALIQKSEDRVDPKCKWFGTCGGCAFQHLRYDKQLEIKRTELIQMMKHLGGFSGEIDVSPVIASPKEYHYRNSVAMSVRHQVKEPFLGFIAKDNRTFLPIDSCPIADQRLNENLAAVKKRFATLVPEQKRFRTSQIVIRKGSGNEIYTSIKVDPESAKELCAQVGGRKFFYSGSSFFQTNFSILEPMVKAVRELLNSPTLTESDAKPSLIDLYSGVGFFSVSLARGYEQVFGIEESEEATAYAVRNSNANQIRNVKFVSGKVEALLDQISAQQDSNLHVIVDPPRSGMKKEVCEHLMKLSNIYKLIYVSCNPATFIRDAQLLSSRYELKKIQPLDMFPLTRHLELIALFEQKDQAS